jgi:hypothetical protein
MILDRDTLETVRLAYLGGQSNLSPEQGDRLRELTGMSLADLAHVSRFRTVFRFSYDADGNVLEVEEVRPGEDAAARPGSPNEVWGQTWPHDPHYPARIECLSSSGRIPGVAVTQVAGSALEQLRGRAATRPAQAAIAAEFGYPDLAGIDDGSEFLAAAAAKGNPLLDAALVLEAADRLDGAARVLEAIDEVVHGGPTP